MEENVNQTEKEMAENEKEEKTGRFGTGYGRYV